MKRFFKLFFFLFLIASPLFADRLSDCYTQLNDEKNNVDKLLDEIADLEKSPRKIVDTIRFCSDRITDKYRFFRTAADLSLMIGDLDSAREFYELAYTARPKSYGDLYMAGVIYYETGYIEQGSKLFGIAAKEDNGLYGEKAKVMLSSILIFKGEAAAGTELLIEVLEAASDKSVLYLIYDVACVNGLESIKAEALQKLGKSGFEGKLASGKSALPVTPSRIFTDHLVLENSNDAERPDTEVGSAEEDQTVDRPSFLQVGAFGKLTNAEVMQSKLKSLGLNSKKIDSGTGIYKVLIPVDPAMDVNNVTLLLKDNNIEIMPIYD